MIKSLTITNHLGNSIKLELMRPDLSGFIVKSIEGLGPTKANINTTNIAASDGVLYNSAYLNQRDIVMTLEFMEGKRLIDNVTVFETIEDVRQKSYKYFPIKKKIRIEIETDNRVLETYGYVEANEPTIFSRNEGCGITVTCPDPFFYSINTSEVIFSGVEALFEFPFENNSLTEPLLEFGAIKNKTDNTVYYKGDHEVGITITIHAIGDVTNISIYNLTTDEQMNLDSNKLSTITESSGIIAGDTITIETKKGSKSITLLREGKMYNILNCLDKGTKWFTLSKGDNIFAYTAETGSSNLQFRITYKNVYEGV